MSYARNPIGPTGVRMNGKVVSMRTFITRLIWLCVIPLLVLATWNAVDNAQQQQDRVILEARHLAQNLALAIDQRLDSQINGLTMLAKSELVAEPNRWQELYRQAQNFQQSFNTHVILAEAEEPRQMLFNTWVPFGDKLPGLPKPDGRAAAPLAVETRQPAVGDSFLGPVADTTLIAVAVPVVRDGRVPYVMLGTIPTADFQKRIDALSIPGPWTIALVDGSGKRIAGRAPPGMAPKAEVDAEERIAVGLTKSQWSVVLEIPRSELRSPMTQAIASFFVGCLVALLLSVMVGKGAARRLVKGVAGLSERNAATDHSDIVEIAKAQERLETVDQQREDNFRTILANEDRFTATFEQAAVGMALVAPDGRWLRINQRLAAIVGYTREELLSKTFQDITHPDDLDADLAQVKRMLAREIDHYSIEKRYLHKDGRPVWVKLTVGLVWKEQGEPDYFVSVIEDITEQKRAESAIRENEARLRMALDAAKAGTWEWDLATHRNIWSDEVFRLYGLAPGSCEPSFASWLDTVHPDDRETATTAAIAAEHHQSELNVEWRVNDPTGAERWLMSRGKPDFDADGHARRYLGIVLDITERKRAETELAAHRQHLEELVDLRTADLAEANSALIARAHEIGELYNRAPCGYHSLAADGTVLAVNDTELELLGYARRVCWPKHRQIHDARERRTVPA